MMMSSWHYRSLLTVCILGKHDNAIQPARSLLGPDAIIGASCYNQLDLALQARSEGADYVAFRTFLSFSTKPAAVQAQPQLLEQARDKLDVPIVAIGGITHDNAPGLINAGADMIAVIDAVFGQSDINIGNQAVSELIYTTRIKHGELHTIFLLRLNNIFQAVLTHRSGHSKALVAIRYLLNQPKAPT